MRTWAPDLKEMTDRIPQAHLFCGVGSVDVGSFQWWEAAREVIRATKKMNAARKQVKRGVAVKKELQALVW